MTHSIESFTKLVANLQESVAILQAQLSELKCYHGTAWEGHDRDVILGSFFCPNPTPV